MKSARDVGWTRLIRAEQLMRRSPRTAAATLTDELEKHPLALFGES